MLPWEEEGTYQRCAIEYSLRNVLKSEIISLKYYLLQSTVPNKHSDYSAFVGISTKIAKTWDRIFRQEEFPIDVKNSKIVFTYSAKS